MKQLLFISTFGLVMIGFVGCNSVPRHFVREEVVIIYYEPIIYDPPYIPKPPTPGPPTKPIIRPGIDNLNPARDLKSKIPNNGGSYGSRDPIQGCGNRNSGEIKPYPPVRKPEQNDRD